MLAVAFLAAFLRPVARVQDQDGVAPVVLTLDDASPGHFRVMESCASLRFDSTSALGVWERFAESHPEWHGRAVFCVLPSADSGHACFGDRATPVSALRGDS